MARQLTLAVAPSSHRRPSEMPWRCPACTEEIRRHPGEDLPRVGIVYRCHVCRIELIFDDPTQKLVLAPFAPENDKRDGEKA